MAKFSRLLFGGVIGAGLAYLFSRKDVRRRLMGGGQAQLPAPGAPRTVFPVAAPADTAPLVEPEVPVDLESRIEETRRQVEEQLEAPFTAPAAVSVEETTLEESEAVVEEAEAIVEEEEEEVVAEAAAADLDEAETEALEEAVETNEFADLRAPAAGEPTTAEQEMREATPAMEAGPAPSQIDRDEMRRRIDETRARLKAKAFDALVSGETFIEPETGEAKQENEETEGFEIDNEIEEQIDRSLREEE